MGSGLTLFATGLLACNGNVCSGKGAKRNAVGINGKCGGTGFKMVDGRAGTFKCAGGGLGGSGSLASAFKGGERGGLTKFNCPGLLHLRRKW